MASGQAWITPALGVPSPGSRGGREKGAPRLGCDQVSQWGRGQASATARGQLAERRCPPNLSSQGGTCRTSRTALGGLATGRSRQRAAFRGSPKCRWRPRRAMRLRRRRNSCGRWWAGPTGTGGERPRRERACTAESFHLHLLGMVPTVILGLRLFLSGPQCLVSAPRAAVWPALAGTSSPARTPLLTLPSPATPWSA